MSAPAAYYDGLLRDPKNAYGLPLEQSPYRELYERAAALVPTGLRICDLGCGSGRFASLVIDNSASYVGIDFSARLIEEARRYTGLDEEFVLDDLRRMEIPSTDVYVCLEVLEHLDDDLALLQSLPHGATVICSVPSFDSASHVRIFPTVRSVRARYLPLLEMDEIDTIELPRPGSWFHLWRAAVR